MSQRALLTALASSLLWTLALELGFYLCSRCCVRRRVIGRDVLLVVLVNVLTNPAVVLLYWLAMWYTGLPRIAVIVVLEISAVLIEGRHYRMRSRDLRRPMLFSIAANALSYGIGTLL